ncbi:MAG: hypothetical protein V7K27_15505 [Nostoc sp.]|uniref:hypothetical protein n=1 Tax=Nostoc sp. TaxID=1180 RepID=UPI002FFA5179
MQSVDDDSLNATAKRVLLDALGIDVNSTVNTVNNDERFQELVDNKTAYLADAMNEIKNSLKAEIDILKLRLDSLAPTIAQIEDEALLESAIASETTSQDVVFAQASKLLSKEEIKSKANSIARTLKSKELEISLTVIKNKILELYPNSVDWISDDTRLDVIRALEKQHTS